MYHTRDAAARAMSSELLNQTQSMHGWSFIIHNREDQTWTSSVMLCVCVCVCVCMCVCVCVCVCALSLQVWLNWFSIQSGISVMHK